MKLGGEDRPQWTMARHWQQLAKDVGVGYKMVRQLRLEMSESAVVESISLQK